MEGNVSNGIHTQVSGSIGNSPREGVDLDVKHSQQKDVYIQNAPFTKSNSSQTTCPEKTDRETQYFVLQPPEFGIRNDDDLQRKLLESLKRTTSYFVEALIDNETFDILDAPEKGDISIFRNDDDIVPKILGNYKDIEYSKGKTVQCLDVHPTQKDIVATSLCHSGPMAEFVPVLNTSTAGYVTIWQHGQTRPRCLLKAPLDCTVFRFNPKQPHLVVGGCRNGTILLWDMSSNEQLELDPPVDYSQERGGNDEARKVILPKALSLPEHSHKQMVADLCWLPANVQINNQGKQLDDAHLSETTSQFVSVSGDGQILFWDVRFMEIMEGKLSHIAKVKVRQMEFDKDFPVMKWVPLFKIKPKRLKGSGELSFSKIAFPGNKSSEIICSSEEGDLVSINWSPGGEDRNEKEHEFASPDYVEWMSRDHVRPTISISLSPFFPFALTVSDWNFHIWYIGDGDSEREPVYTSPTINRITEGKWSPTRPGVVLIAKNDGSIEVWDFVANGCHTPHITIPLLPNGITSMCFTSCPQNNIIALGEKKGSLYLCELPRHLVHPYPNERR